MIYNKAPSIFSYYVSEKVNGMNGANIVFCIMGSLVIGVIWWIAFPSFVRIMGINPGSSPFTVFLNRLARFLLGAVLGGALG